MYPKSHLGIIYSEQFGELTNP